MKCDDCVNLLEEYIDGEADDRDAEMVSAHLFACAHCTQELEAMTAEQEIYSRYDRDLEIPPSLWNAIAARTAESRASDSTSQFNLRAWLAGLFALPRYGLAGALVVLIVGAVVGVMYLRTPQQSSSPTTIARMETVPPAKSPDNGSQAIHPPSDNGRPRSLFTVRADQRVMTAKTSSLVPKKSSSANQPDVLFSDIAYSEIEDRDTAEHIAQAQNLLRSIRNIQLSANENEVDVTYEKAMSRRLLSVNEVLRRDAEMAGKFPTKELLGDLEPFLIDIANLPDKATPDGLRVIKDRAQKTEIVAALVGY